VLNYETLLLLKILNPEEKFLKNTIGIHFEEMLDKLVYHAKRELFLLENRIDYTLGLSTGFWT